jgi:hypothetical protein
VESDDGGGMVAKDGTDDTETNVVGVGVPGAGDGAPVTDGAGGEPQEATSHRTTAAASRCLTKGYIC